ncbi:hypothetical protein RclHR1_00180017 [Rhizophagus clarus]|uniref:Uncharacterized protein n=1 Tax=Rhizophagus clarus TaxID=94130 RepID=A0A2Z6QYM3_9GLOM|nr:hypothetical protein RclHR1_00180017 [Rhizophagus clarus]GES73041.1 hypothetical protein GLOIN_2v1876629 [Rhizophagus clarus]
MSRNILQNDQNDPTFTESNNLQPTDVQPEHSSNINYNDVFDNPSDNNFPMFYTNNNNFDQQSSTYNENISSNSVVSSYAPQNYVDPQQPIQNTSFNMNTINPSQSGILSFDIPGFKIIVIPTFSQQDNTYLNYSSSDFTNTQFTQFQQ